MSGRKFVCMRVTASLPDTDAEFLERYRRTHNLESRSAAVSRAVRALHEAELAEQYRAAYLEWKGSGDGAGIRPPATVLRPAMRRGDIYRVDPEPIRSGASKGS